MAAGRYLAKLEACATLSVSCGGEGGRVLYICGLPELEVPTGAGEWLLRNLFLWEEPGGTKVNPEGPASFDWTENPACSSLPLLPSALTRVSPSYSRLET